MKTYTQYETNGYPLGYPYGPDFDEIFVRIGYRLKRRVVVHYSLSYIRKGEPNIHTKWPIKPQGEWDKFPLGSAFLWGTIEYRTKHTIGISYDFENWELNLNLGYWRIRNHLHKRGATLNTPILSLSLIKHFNTSINNPTN